MNPDTRVAVCCYAGDAHQVITMLPLYLHHKCPITVLSPDDSRADVRYDGVDNCFGGKRAYTGQDCLDRMREHLKILLTFPENHFLIHDADSICIAPQLPQYLYDEPDTVWSCVINNGISWQQAGYPEGTPHVAFHPPWFLSRKTIQTLLTVSEGCTVSNDILPFIDYWFVEMTLKAGLTWKPLAQSISAPISAVPAEMRNAERMVRNGELIFLHSIKGEKYAAPIMRARNMFIGGGLKA